MDSGSARLLARLLGDDPTLTTLINRAEAGTADDAEIQEWINANRQRVRERLIDKLPPVPALRDAVPVEPPIDGWAPRVELGVARIGVESSAATLQRQVVPQDKAVTHVLGLLPPDAASLVLEAGPVSGGGRIQVLGDQASGALGLQIGAIRVNAFALVGGSAGTASVAVVLGVRFVPPVQLSFGFALSGVGGVVGVNRRIDVDGLRRRLADGSALDALFPADAQSGAGRLLAALSDILHPADGQHVVGPTFTITWLDIGATTLVRLDVGVLIQLPDGKVVIVGRAAIDLAPVLALRLDVVGEIDPGRKLVGIDAVLVDSRALALFRVTGTAAFRSCAADPPYVVATLGGFYPGFHPEPAAIPPQQRVGLALDVPCPLTIRANGYLAITSNTFQVGADVEVALDLDVIGARGFLRFDAIIQFDPFHLHADYEAGWEVWVSIFSGGTTVSGWIDGPGPWAVHARVSIDLLFDDFSWSDTFRFGPVGPPAAAAIEHLADFVAAHTLSLPSNLKATDTTDREVAIRPRPGGLAPGTVLCSPMATLTWSQDVVPLELPVRRVAGQRLASEQSLRLKVAGAVAEPVQDEFSDIDPDQIPGYPSDDGAAISEWFAPGTFLELTQAEALTLPPFQFLKAGTRLQLPLHFGPAGSGSTEYETYLRRGSDPTPAEDVPVSLTVPVAPLRISAMVQGRLAAAVVTERSPLIKVGQEPWIVNVAGQPEPALSAAHAIVAARTGGIALSAFDRPVAAGAI